MNDHEECVAMILAGGQGSRLGVLTRYRAKPAVPYGGKYRIIDFTLSNCENSGIGVVGVLTQYEPFVLNSYIGTGAPWDLDSPSGGVFVLSPYTRVGDVGSWYAGTADAIYQTINIIEDGHIVEKKHIALPEKLVNVIRCKNPRCITSVEPELDQIFKLSDRAPRIYRCIYCDTKAE